MTVSPDGKTVFVTRESAGTTSGYDDATIAYNPPPAPQWVRRYDPRNGLDRARGAS